MTTQLTATQTYPTTVFASVQPRMLNEVTEQLRKIQGITYFSPVIGRFDLAIELKASEQQQVYELVNKIRSLNGVTSTRTYTPTMAISSPRTVQASDSLAIVLLQVNEPAQKILASLQQHQHVRNAFVVSGEFDIIASIYGKNQDEVLSQVPKIAEMQGVKTSETLLAYKPSWQ
ncbi:MAG: Lrp/AsnC ligand binding domain-containing protein [Thaumarchaeota archaeon]|nr:Lrp/AsnC ligand binding domain-containing protein [Nitrososphaerota archaeon]